MSQSPRFERVDTIAHGGKIRNWTPDNIEPDPGAFLARLWPLFGPPNVIGDDGFAYFIGDRQTGLEFEAYSGASGPAYGGNPRLADRLAETLKAFDAVLAISVPIDCAIEVGTGSIRFRIGFHAGAPFLEPLTPADSYRDALSDARDRIKDRSAGFWICWGALSVLEQRWTTLPPADRPIPETEHFDTARRLWVRTLETAEALSRAWADGSPDLRQSDVETLADFGLDDLTEAGRRLMPDFSSYAGRIAETRDRLASAG